MGFDFMFGYIYISNNDFLCGKGEENREWMRGTLSTLDPKLKAV